MALRSAIGRALARERGDGTRTPNLAQLVLPKSQRSFPRETEAWLDRHDLGQLLESLAAHLLRTLPEDELMETDAWVDTQRGRQGGRVAPMSLDDIADRRPVETSGPVDPGLAVERGNWAGREVQVVTVAKDEAPSTPAGRAQNHRFASVAGCAPFLVGLRHEALLPVYGFVSTSTSCSLVHPAQGTSLAALVRPTCSRRLMVSEVATVANDIASGLSHMHALGFVHRNICPAAVLVETDGDDGGDSVGRWTHGLLAEFSYCVRTSRGRVTTAGWIPQVHAPELPHTRTFDWSTDVFAMGVTLLSACLYGDIVRARRIADTLQRPPAVPRALWDTVIAPCLAPVPEGRAAAASVSKNARTLLEGVRDANGGVGAASEDGAIPLPTDTVDSETLNALVRAHVPPSAASDAVVTCEGLFAPGWVELCRVAAMNPHLSDLTINGASGIDPRALVPVCQKPTLKRLSLRLYDGAETGAQGWMEALTQLSGEAVVSVALTGIPLSDKNGATLVRHLGSACPALRSLTLRDVAASRATAAALVECREHDKLLSLESLAMSGEALTASAISLVVAHWLPGTDSSKRPGLRVFDISGTRLDYYTVAAIAQGARRCSDLQRLVLTGCGLSQPSQSLLSAAQSEAVAPALVIEL